MHDVIGNNVLYKLGTGWGEVNKFQVRENENNDTLSMVFATLPGKIVRKLGVEQTNVPSPDVIDLKNATCLVNKSVISSTPGQTELSKWDWEMVTSRKRPHNESKDLG